MRSFTGELLLIFVIFLCSIELISSQASPSRPVAINLTRQPRRMKLPPPLYYNEEGRIRAKGHPNVTPLMFNVALCGMTDGTHFFPIYHGGKMYVIDFNKREYVEVKEQDRKTFLENAEAGMGKIRETCGKYNV